MGGKERELREMNKMRTNAACPLLQGAKKVPYHELLHDSLTSTNLLIVQRQTAFISLYQHTAVVRQARSI
jgi:hypothetical protein